MIEQTGPELFMSSSEYSHHEGGKNPLTKFKEALWTTGRDAQSRFYHRTMAELLTRSTRA